MSGSIYFLYTVMLPDLIVKFPPQQLEYNNYYFIDRFLCLRMHFTVIHFCLSELCEKKDSFFWSCCAFFLKIFFSKDFLSKFFFLASKSEKNFKKSGSEKNVWRLLYLKINSIENCCQKSNDFI